MMSPSSVTIAFVAMGSLALLAGCGSGSDSTCASFESKLRSCSLIPMGTDIACEEPTGDAETCRSNCMLKASCSDLRTAFCGNDISRSWETCLAQCERFTCGNGVTIDVDYRCDGEPDCDDGSDEFGCASLAFTCRDGETVEADYRCDGESDCDDDSDELGCPTFTCRNGEAIPERYKCDDDEDCADGSDEIGCPPSLDDILTCE